GSLEWRVGNAWLILVKERLQIAAAGRRIDSDALPVIQVANGAVIGRITDCQPLAHAASCRRFHPGRCGSVRRQQDILSGILHPWNPPAIFLFLGYPHQFETIKPETTILN